MPEIKPFRALHYNQAKIRDISAVVCPPYDVISPAQQENYYAQNEHNFIRVLLGKDLPGDDGRENKYTRAKRFFDQWQQEGILIEDSVACIYYYRQEYKIMGQRYARLGFIALMRLEDEGASKIYPHENTHMKAKEDRLKLWRTLSANLSSIFVCYADKGKKVQTIFDKHVSNTKPFIEVKDEDGVGHTVWRLENPGLIKEIADSVASQQLFIADGHHRYEVAKEYRRQRLERAEKSDGQESFQYIMTYFTNVDSQELKIFPMHRIVKTMPPDLMALEEYFRIDKIKRPEELVLLLAKAGRNEHAFGFYTREGIKLLRLKNKLLIDKCIQEGSKAYRHLDAMILKTFVFDKVGIRSEEIIYTKDLQEAVNRVKDGLADASFIMNPVSIQQFKEIALNGERMPPKTTYFYPKVLSGLTLYKTI